MIKLSSPDINDEDIQRVIEVLKSENLVQGINVSKLEYLLSEYAKIPYSVVVSSGTAALHLALMAIGISRNDSVIIPAFTFPATANVVEISGGNVILTDVDKTSYVTTPEAIENALINNKDKNVKAVIVVHEFGYPAQIKKIAKITKKYSICLIEDAACALGTIADGHHVGFYSDMACFSFHPRKTITTGEGGAVITNNSKFSKKIKILRNHGIFKSKDNIDFIYAGLNYRMTDFQAALSIGQLDRFDKELEKRKSIAAYYFDLLKDTEFLTLPKNNDFHSWQSFMVVIDKSINRENVINELFKKGIETNYGAYAISCLNYYQKKYSFKENDFKIATELYKNGLAIPLYGKLVFKDILYITECLKSVLGNC